MKNFNYKILLFILLSTGTVEAQSPQRHTLEKFYVIGISLRTSNQDGQAAQDIETLWERFWGEEIQKQIPNKVNEDIYAVYTDYESDFRGPYTSIIGAAVTSLDSIPEGFVGITLEKELYQKYRSKGKMPEAILNTWIGIWQDTELKRAYTADFTVHGEKYFLGDQAEVETFIAVKE